MRYHTILLDTILYEMTTYHTMSYHPKQYDITLHDIAQCHMIYEVSYMTPYRTTPHHTIPFLFTFYQEIKYLRAEIKKMGNEGVKLLGQREKEINDMKSHLKNVLKVMENRHKVCNSQPLRYNNLFAFCTKMRYIGQITKVIMDWLPHLQFITSVCINTVSKVYVFIQVSMLFVYISHMVLSSSSHT